MSLPNITAARVLTIALMLLTPLASATARTAGERTSRD
jgi:hypothetical protein